MIKDENNKALTIFEIHTVKGINFKYVEILI